MNSFLAPIIFRAIQSLFSYTTSFPVLLINTATCCLHNRAGNENELQNDKERGDRRGEAVVETNVARCLAKVLTLGCQL
jgi:hypothetical protein